MVKLFKSQIVVIAALFRDLLGMFLDGYGGWYIYIYKRRNRLASSRLHRRKKKGDCHSNILSSGWWVSRASSFDDATQVEKYGKDPSFLDFWGIRFFLHSFWSFRALNFKSVKILRRTESLDVPERYREKINKANCFVLFFSLFRQFFFSDLYIGLERDCRFLNPWNGFKLCSDNKTAFGLFVTCGGNLRPINLVIDPWWSSNNLGQ